MNENEAFLQKSQKRLPCSCSPTRSGQLYTVESKWLEHLWDHEFMFETGVVRANEFNHSFMSEGKIETAFRFSLT